MGEYSLTKNSFIDIDLAEDIKDNGWTVANGVAVHHGCNQGNIELQSFPYVVGVPNNFRYEVIDYSSGLVQLKVGTHLGQVSNTLGEKVDVITPTLNDKVLFYSDGNLGIRVLSISSVSDSGAGVTFAFDEKSKLWVTYYYWKPEFMLNFNDKFFTFKNGEPYLHNSNPIRNNFYGEQSKSVVKFYVNINPDTLKNFFTIWVNSSHPWAITDIYIYPVKGKSQGMKSRIKIGDFKKYLGKWRADFRRNMLDPRFDDQLKALFKGAMLQGDVMEITMENTDTVEVRLIDVQVEVDVQNYTV